MFIDLTVTLAVDRTGWCRQADFRSTVRAELSDAVVGSGKGTGRITATPPM